MACKANPLSVGLKPGELRADKIHKIRDMKANRKLAPGLRVAKSRIDGMGCFAAFYFRQNQEIAEFVGERIALAEAERRRSAPGKKCICDVDPEWSIDGSCGGNSTQYINHSCEPNSYLIISQGHVFLHALRDMAPGEEITVDYLFELALEGTQCNCQAASCVKKIGLGITSEDELSACARSPINRPTSRPFEGGCS